MTGALGESGSLPGVALSKPGGSRQEKRGNPADGGVTPPGAKGEAMTGAKLNKIYTEFVFFKASHDESTAGVVYSFPLHIQRSGSGNGAIASA